MATTQQTADGVRKVTEKTVPVSDLSDSERYQVKSDLSETKNEHLKRQIGADGITRDLYITSNNEILDGFHRRRIAEELGIATVDTIVFEGSEVELKSKARSANLDGEDSDDGLKKDFITEQLLDLDDAGEHWTDQRIADELGVSRQWVDRIRRDLASDGKFATTGNLPTSMQRDIARNLLDSDNEFTQADIAEESGLSRKTVGKLARGEDTEADSEPETEADSSPTTNGHGSGGSTSGEREDDERRDNENENENQSGGSDSTERSPTQTRREIRHTIEANPDASTRAVAEHVGIDEATVADVRSLLDVGPGTSSRPAGPTRAVASESTADESVSSTSDGSTSNPNQPNARSSSGNGNEPTTPPSPGIESEPQSFAFASDIDPPGWSPLPDNEGERAENTERLKEYASKMDAIANDPDVKRRKKLMRSLSAHMAVSLVGDELSCPDCGSGVEHLEWTCCGHGVSEARELVEERVQESVDEIGSDESYGVM